MDCLRLKAIFVLSTLFVSVRISHAAIGCQQVKAAFDIGSGTTKLKVAEVDTCKQKIVKYLYEENVPVAYKQNIDSNAQFTEQIQTEGIQKLKELKLKIAKFSPSSYQAAATAAFREAKNAKKFAAKIEQETGIKVFIIDQKVEAKVGFFAATSHAKVNPEKLIVWDIGGGSMQITSYEGKGKFKIYEGDIASVTFKNMIIEQVQAKKEKSTTTPNPISQKDFIKALSQARDKTTNSDFEQIKQRLNSPDVQILGIGGVHYHSVNKQVGNKDESYNFFQVAKVISESLGKKDTDIGGQYADTQISNLILVLGFMSGLGIDKVDTANVNLSDGVLLASPDTLSAN